MNKNPQSIIYTTIDALSDMQDEMEQLQKQLIKLENHLEDASKMSESGSKAQRPKKKSRFEQCLDITLKHEGGWSDDPNDPGGATMRGITLKTYRDWVARNPLATPGGVLPSKSDLRDIPRGHLRVIYRGGYWDAIQADKMPPGVDLVMFDFAVNSGPVRAVIELQRFLGSILPGHLADDGIMGPRTLEAMDDSKPYHTVLGICGCRLQFCKKLKNWPHHGAGWTNRIKDIRKTALAMAGLKGEA
tara:strand:+ start:8080 stop:8814 length:735 start_codon:yes stop_codon:yes gene_type:complete